MARKLGLALAATLFALLLSELVVRVLGLAPEVKAIDLESADCVYKRSINPILGFELKANYRNDDPDFIATYERTNAHGLRDRERSLEKPPGARRILLLGDSVVEGHGLAETDTISRQWEALYADGKTEVLNFGVSAYCTLAEIELLARKGLAFEPDVVVVLFVENDFDNFNREAFALESATQRPEVVEGLFQRSEFFRLASIRLNLFQLGAEADPAGWNSEAIGDNNVFEGFKRLRGLADREGFKPVVVVWPHFSDEAVVERPLVPEGSMPVVEALAAVHGLPCARLAPVFERSWNEAGREPSPRLAFSSGDGLHPSPQGAAIAASGLREIVAELEAGRLVPRSGVAEDVALEWVESLGEVTPDYARLFHGQGVSLLKDGRYEEAIANFRKALEEDLSHAGAHGNMGLAYERLGDLPRAKQAYLRAIELQSDFEQAHFNLARLALSEGNVDQAISSLRWTIEISPDHADALNLLGMELGKAGKFGEAQAHLEKAVQVEPDFSEAHNNLGTVYAAQGDLGKAVEQFREAVRSDPANEGAAARLKQVEAMLRDRQ